VYYLYALYSCVELVRL